MPYPASSVRKSWLGDSLPRSLLKIRPASVTGWRLNQAMRCALLAFPHAMSWRSDQPAARRLNRAITTARNSYH